MDAERDENQNSTSLMPGEHLPTTSSSLAQKAKKMGVKLQKQKIPSSRSSSKPSSPDSFVKVSRPSSASRSPVPQDCNSNLKRASICSDSSAVGNATLRRMPDNMQALPRTLSHEERAESLQNTMENQHYNDTVFGDEQQMATNDFDSIRDNYQHNLASVSDDERSKSHNHEGNLILTAKCISFLKNTISAFK